MPSAMENLLGWGLFLLVLLAQGVSSYDYGEALSKSLLYFEAQRSGKLPDNQRVTWRADSGLKDGQDATVDLTGGYYDSGDNVKFGFPLAFTATMLSWSAIEFEDRLQAKNELSNSLQAVKWATDYIIKSHPEPNVLYGEVGEGHSDHDCWQRPEDMTTPRTPFKIDEQNPGSDLAAESAAALAAASIAFKKFDASYSTTLITHAKQLFDFACNHTGKYQDSIKEATEFYSSSGFQELKLKLDELVWAAAWLFRATHEQPYLEYVASVDDVGGTRTMFSWDDKYVGAQVLVAKLVLGSEVPEDGNWVNYKNHAEEFICSVIQKHSNNVKKTGGGLLWWDQPWNVLQYTTTATFVTLAYSDYLANADAVLKCQSEEVSPADLITFSKTQVDYILGSNPSNMSYMVGFGTKYPEKVHHRGASIVSIKKDPTPVTCKGGYESYFNRDAPNVNVLTGAIVGGPNDQDSYEDSRSNFQQAEPATVNTAPFVGVLARLAE